MSSSHGRVEIWRIVLPFAVAGGLALLPVPAGLAQHAWYYFAIFSGVSEPSAAFAFWMCLSHAGELNL